MNPNSVAAFEASQQSAETRQKTITDLLQRYPQGMTSFEIEAHLEWSHQSVSATLSVLERNARICRRKGRAGLSTSPTGNQCSKYYALDYVAPAERTPVIRSGKVVVHWVDAFEEWLMLN